MRIKIDNEYCQCQKGEYLLEVARRNSIEIPSLCHNEGLPGLASCRLCIVEVIDRGKRKVVTSCVYPIRSEIEVITNSDKIIRMRKTIIMFLSSRAPNNKYINKLRKEYSVKKVSNINNLKEENCILCGLCVKACDELGTGAIATINRGIKKEVSTPYSEPSQDCIGCGACANVCPTDAIEIEDKYGKRKIWDREFELVSCNICGRKFATREELDFINKKLDNDSYKDICNKCKRKVAGEKFKEIYMDIR